MIPRDSLATKDPTMKFDDKVVLITGASRGLGRGRRLLGLRTSRRYERVVARHVRPRPTLKFV